MDLATLIGMVLGFAIVSVVMILEGGSPVELFTHPSPIILTVGGAVAATMMSFPLKVTIRMPKLIMVALMGQVPEPAEAIEVLSRMADKARREGLLALEEEAKQLEDPFLRKGVMLVVDGVDPAQVKDILRIEIEQMKERHHQGAGFFESAGGFGPTMGIIGTVMGLITVLQELDEPSKLGQSIAVAFLATLWGIMSANLIWLPLGAKLKAKSEEEVAYRHMLLEGVMALQAGENPRIVREKLSAFLPPAERTEEPIKATQQAGAEA